MISGMEPKLVAAAAVASNKTALLELASREQSTPITIHGFLTNPDNLKVILPLASVGLVLLMIVMTALYFTLWRCFNKMHLKSSEMTNYSLNETYHNSSYGTYGDKEQSQGLNQRRENEPQKKEIKQKSWSSFNIFGTLFRRKSDNLIASDSEADAASSVDQKELNKILNRKKNKSGKEDENIKLKKISLSTSSCSQYNSNSSLSSLSKIVSNDNISKYSARGLDSKPNIIVNFSIYFNNNTKCLFVNVISLENVKVTSSMSQSSELNVYVKMEIKMPDAYLNENKDNEDIKKLLNKMAKTRLIKNTSNPVFDETFEFENFKYLDQATKSSGDSFQLIFYICNSNLFGRDQLIGQLEHTIHKKDLLSSKELVISPSKDSSSESLDKKAYVCRVYSQKVDPIDSRLSEAHSLGQLNMSLIYDDSTQVIKIHLINGTNIKMPRYYTNKNKIPSPFIKIYLLYRGQRLEKKQTKIVEKTSDPVYDETFEFNLVNLLQILMPQENMAFDTSTSDAASSSKAAPSRNILTNKIASRLQFLLLVMDWDQVEKSDVIGKIELKTQHHLQRLITNQHLSRNKSLDTEFLKTDAGVNESDNDSTRDETEQGAAAKSTFVSHHIKKPDKAIQHNWFDIFNRPNVPILGTFQINNY